MVRSTAAVRAVPQSGEAARLALGPTTALGALLAGVLAWAYWPVLVRLWKDWDDPNYSAGPLVPLAAMWILWNDRAALRNCAVRACWWGLLLLLAAQAANLFGLVYLYESAERYSIVLTIAGLVLLVVGPALLWRVRWVLAFLALMVPLPGQVHNRIAGPLQEFASLSTTFVLELAGVDVARQGNVITLDGQVPIGISEACGGLRMLTAFVMVAAVLAFLVQRPRWQRATLVLCSVPVAIICNVARTSVTAVLYLYVDSDVARHFFHDFAGITMMPLAIVILIGELWLMNFLAPPATTAGAGPALKSRL